MPNNASLLTRYNREIDKAEREALRIYQPTEMALPVHTSKCHELIIIGGKRSGKSTAAAAEVASRICGIPIIGPDGNPLPLQWPVSTPENPLTFWFIGINITHIGKTLHRLMFQHSMGGKFRAIKDERTGLWRAYNNAYPPDIARSKESRPAGPMIPPRMIPGKKAWSWYEGSSNEFQSVRLTNGAIIYAFASSGRSPAMGDAVDGIWINEDVLFPKFVSEWQDRLNDTDGWMIWDAFAQMQNEMIAELVDRADAVASDPERNIEVVQLIYSRNPYIRDAAKRRALERMGSEEEIARRDRGELRREIYRMYDYYPGLHLLSRADVDAPRPQRRTARSVLEDLYGRYGRLPASWSRYLAIDPSHTRTAVLSFVITPYEYKGVVLNHRVIVEWDMVFLKALGKDVATQLKERMDPVWMYRAFIMDNQKGQQTNAQEGRDTFRVWSDAFQQVGLRSIETAYGFIGGLPAPKKCQGIVRMMLAEIIDDMPRLLFCEDETRATRAEFKTFRKKVSEINGIETIQDEAANPRVHDCMAALQYGAREIHVRLQNNTAFIMDAGEDAPSSRPLVPDWLTEALDQHRNKRHQIHLGPGVSAA